MQKRVNQRAVNKAVERSTLLGTKTQRRKKYKDIIKELGQRNITFSDISQEDFSESSKYKGFLDMLKTTDMTFDDAVILQQYARAITNGDTKAATFLRDTAEGSPKQQIDLTTDDNGLAKMSYEELISLRDALTAHSSTTSTSTE